MNILILIFFFADGSRTITFKIVLFALRFTAMFIIASYEAVILSFLTVQLPEIPFTNIEEFAKNKEYQLNSFNESGFYPRFTLSVIILTTKISIC